MAAACAVPTGVALTPAVNWLTAAVPIPDSVTTAFCPLLPTTVNEPVAGPADVGLYVTCTGVDCPGISLVPTAGRLVAVNCPDGGITLVMVWVTVPRLVMSTISGTWMPTGTGMMCWSGSHGNVCVPGAAGSIAQLVVSA